MYKVLVIGAVTTTKHTLNQLVKHGFDVVGVLGFEPKDYSLVSGWVDLRSLSADLEIEFKGYQKINDSENIAWANARQPDIIFAVGFSQLISNEWLDMPKLGCIGFHPTKLPKGRGRAPMAWLTLEVQEGAACFFLMGEGADDGPIFVQQEFKINQRDDAGTVEVKIEIAINQALEKWLPQLRKGAWNPVPQNELEATWYGVRKPEDGRIDWHKSAVEIDRLIKASSTPHPGAYTYFKDEILTIWKSEVEKVIPIKGVVGRILLKDELKGYLVQCGEGIIWINEIEFETDLPLRIGDKLGYNVEDELFQIKKQLRKLLNEK